MEFKLIIKKLNNTLSETEAREFNDWYNESANHRLYFKRVKENYQEELDLIDAEKAWSKLSSQLRKSKKKPVYWKYAVAAAVILLLSVPFILNYVIGKTSPEPVIVNDIIKPGVNKAILTLEDGSQVVLDKNSTYQSTYSISNGEEISYNSNTSESSEMLYNILTIPRGGEFFVKLSDNTKVWLNSESQLKYPVNFIEGKERAVELVYGEAYFEVSPSTEHKGTKFKVLNNNQAVEVLGTKFNVKAYLNETEIFTTLAEGKVAINSNTINKFLSPGQQSVLNLETRKIDVKAVDVKTELSWVHGSFVFHYKSLKEITKVLSRWYDVDFKFDSKSIEKQEFNGELNKKQNLEEILMLIKATNKINHFEIKNKEVLIK